MLAGHAGQRGREDAGPLQPGPEKCAKRLQVQVTAKGNKMVAATLEYRFPVAKKVEGVVFGDTGNAWSGGLGTNPNSSLKSAVGVGLRVTTPLGPVRLDYAKGSEGNKFHFSFGGQF